MPDEKRAPIDSGRCVAEDAEATLEGSSGLPEGKRALLVSFDFPPRRNSGVYRPSCMTKYLPQTGWTPTVLTVRPLNDDTIDESLNSRVPANVRVVRTRYFRLDGWETCLARPIKRVGALGTPAKAAGEHRADRLIREAGDWLRSLLYFPDSTTGWVPFAFLEAVYLNAHSPFGVVYVTSPPRSALLVGCLLKRFLGLPLVAEFRDPWYTPIRKLRKVSERWVLKTILDTADEVVVVAEGLYDEFRREYGVSSDKLSFIPNGFDEEEFAQLAQDSPSKRLFSPGLFHFAHFGTVYPGLAGSFFSALKELVAESPDLKQRLRVHIIGYPDRETARFAEEPDLQEVIALRPFLPHDDALRAMAQVSCLLMFLGDREFSRLAVAGKVYEYLRAGSPVLAVAYPGGAQRLIEEAGAGWVANPGDKQAMKSAILRAMESGRRPTNAIPNQSYVQQFRYDHLARRLAKVFDRATDTSKSKGGSASTTFVP